MEKESKFYNMQGLHKVHINIARLIVLVLLIQITGSHLVYASSASISITTKDDTVSVGDTIPIILSVEADAIIGDFEAFIAYDSDILEFESGGPFISGDDGLLRISDVEPTDEENTRKYVMKFKAIKIGASVIGIADKAMVYNYEDGLEMSVSSKKLSISVKASATASENANLQVLKISPAILSPEFDVNTTSYKAEIENNVTKLIVSGVTEDEKANISVSGASKLDVGENTVKVVVTAEAGNKKEYIILVTRNSESEEDDESIEDLDNNENPPETETKDKFMVSNENGEIFIANKYKYQVVQTEEDITIPNGYVKTKLILYGIPITAYTLEADLENDFFLIYALNEDGEKSFYQYDRIEKTMQRYANEEMLSENQANQNTNVVMTIDEYKEKLEQLSVVIAFLSAFSAFLILIVIRLYMKQKGYKEDDLE